MKKINIFELHRTIHEKNQRKEECYEKVLEYCHKKITIAAENKKLRCVIDVPEYMYGYPLYNLNDCINFIINHMQKNGFLVNYYFPKILYVSWDFEEIKKPKIASHPQNNTLTSSLLTKPAVSLNKKTSGKLALNLHI
jgi:hypothetical protein